MIPARGAPLAGAPGELGELGKTSWVDATMADVLRDLQHAVPQELLPLTLEEVSRYSVQEFGCGAYGCVMPTRTKNLVLKLTGDPTEAIFAGVAMKLAEREGWPDGIVRYHRALELPLEGPIEPEGEDYEYQRLFLLWRDEVKDPGFLSSKRRLSSAESAARDGMLQYMLVIDQFYEVLPRSQAGQRALLTHAGAPRLSAEVDAFVLPRLERGEQPHEIAAQAASIADDARQQPLAAAVILACARMSLVATLDSPVGAPAAGAALYYFDQGLLLSDLHTGNLARSVAPPHHAVISDPGVVVALDKRYFGAEFPREWRLHPAPTARRRAELSTQPIPL